MTEGALPRFKGSLWLFANVKWGGAVRTNFFSLYLFIEGQIHFGMSRGVQTSVVPNELLWECSSNKLPH